MMNEKSLRTQSHTFIMVLHGRQRPDWPRGHVSVPCVAAMQFFPQQQQGSCDLQTLNTPSRLGCCDLQTAEAIRVTKATWHSYGITNINILTVEHLVTWL
jgi:hypothetical protein